MRRDVMVRRDGRVEVRGERMSEDAAVAWLRENGHGELVLWLRRECASGRRFCRKRNMPWFDAAGKEMDR